MGRGRQKAKHQKVARQLKYHTSTIDVTALERELSTSAAEDSQYAEYANGYGDEDDDPHDEDED